MLPFPSLSREGSLIWWYLSFLLPKFYDFLEMLCARVTHTTGNEKLIALPWEIWIQIIVLSSINHWVVIHTLLRFENRKIGGVNFAHEKHLGWAMISVKRCVFVTGVPLKNQRLFCVLPTEVQPWSFPPVSKMALSFIFRACFEHSIYPWTPEEVFSKAWGLWNFEDNFPRCCVRVLFLN